MLRNVFKACNQQVFFMMEITIKCSFPPNIYLSIQPSKHTFSTHQCLKLFFSLALFPLLIQPCNVYRIIGNINHSGFALADNEQ